jgi:pyridoxamine 5'-phosphate oxidase
MLHNIRKQYELLSLEEREVLSNPFDQFSLWLNDAVNSEQPEPTAMVLSTVDEQLKPHSRVVLLKEINAQGLVFYTNYAGQKARQMSQNNFVSALFFWPLFERQVRILGSVEKVSEEISTEYFHSRPLESQIGAWASPQSEVIPGKEYIEQQFEIYKDKFGTNVPKPPHWGGYVIYPDSFEFWQGRPNRLHDRLIFEKDVDGWKISRLAP